MKLCSLKLCFSFLDFCKFVSNIATKWKSWFWSWRGRSNIGSFMATLTISLWSILTISGIIRLSGYDWKESHWPKICSSGKKSLIMQWFLKIHQNLSHNLAVVGTIRFGRSTRARLFENSASSYLREILRSSSLHKKTD